MERWRKLQSALNVYFMICGKETKDYKIMHNNNAKGRDPN